MKKHLLFIGLMAAVLSVNAQNKVLDLTDMTKEIYAGISAMNINALPVTIECWIKPAANQIDGAGFVFSRSTNTVAGLFLKDDGELRYTWNDENSDWSSGLYPAANQWSHVAMVVEADKATIYLNGTAAIHTVTHSPEEFDDWVAMGIDKNLATYSVPGISYNGYLDEVRIWNSARTAQEIVDNKYTISNPASQTNLLAYYNLNEIVTSKKGKVSLPDLTNKTYTLLENLTATNLVTAEYDTATDVEDVQNNADRFIMLKGSQLELNATTANASFGLYDLSGRCVYRQLLASGQNVIELSRFNGLYIAQFTQDGQAYTKKIVLRK